MDRYWTVMDEVLSRSATVSRIDKGEPRGVSDGTRTRDHLDHNQELYQLSYAHRG